MLKEFDIRTEKLSHSRLMIQGFNEWGQKAVGAIRHDLYIEEMATSVLLHVVDCKTSYNMLLGGPWLHCNGVEPSTLHQYFKYVINGTVKKFVVDDKLFTKAKAYITNVKFYS